MGVVNTWLADRTQPNPYAPSGKVAVSEQKVRADLRAQEKLDEAALEEDAEAGEGSEEDLGDEGLVSDRDQAETESHGEGAHRHRKTTRRMGRGATKRRGRPSKPQKSIHRITPAAFIILGLQLEDSRSVNFFVPFL